MPIAIHTLVVYVGRGSSFHHQLCLRNDANLSPTWIFTNGIHLLKAMGYLSNIKLSVAVSIFTWSKDFLLLTLQNLYSDLIGPLWEISLFRGACPFPAPRKQSV